MNTNTPETIENRKTAITILRDSEILQQCNRYGSHKIQT